MIGFLKGTVFSVVDNTLLLDVGGVGYRVFITGRDAAAMPGPGEEIMIFTHTSVREDAIWLYGFLSEEDLTLYRRLIQVSGIGPKGGLALLSAMSADELGIAILREDDRQIARTPGIGLKTARKLILELKDKLELRHLAPIPEENHDIRGETLSDQNKAEAVAMMTALGYSSAEALRAVKNARLTEGMTSDEILRAALRENL